MFHSESNCRVTRSAEELHSEYSCIFENGNRNAASHKWANHVLSHSKELSLEEVVSQLSSFCPVSGSPVSGARRGWEESFSEGDEVHYCCWPCSCDLRDAIREERAKVEDVMVETKEGKTSLKLILLKDVCKERELSNEETTPVSSAPDVVCKDGKMTGATHVGDDFFVIGMASESSSSRSNRVSDFTCERRAEKGYKNGMGDIFRRVASLDSL